MVSHRDSEKPRQVLFAEWALWAWTAWVCLFGLYETSHQIPELEQTITDTFQGMINIAPTTLLLGAAGGYAALAAISALIVYKIGAGRHWARSSLAWGFAFELLTMGFPPYHKPTAMEVLKFIPDLSLQIYSLYILYTYPGSIWFQPKPKK